MTTGVTDELIASLAKAAGTPVDFDLTVFVLIALFLVLMVYYNHVLFRPYLKIRDIRHERIQGAKQTARETEARAEEVFDEYEQHLSEAVDEGNAERRRIKESAKQEEREILTQARQELETMLESGRAELNEQLDKARLDLEKQAKDISTLIVDKVLAP